MLYLLMLVGRMCGVIYACNSDKLGWFEEE
jgi:hypothetical protein